MGKSREIELLREVLEEEYEPEPRPSVLQADSVGSSIEKEDEWEEHLMKARRREDLSRVSQRILREARPEPTVEQAPSIIQQMNATVGWRRRAQPWLQGVSRRTLRHIKRTYTPEEIYQLITSRSWPYRTWAPHYHKRDRCFLALLYLTAGRICEVLSLKRSQFDLKADPQFIIIRNMITEKIGPASSNLPFREEFPLPREGDLKPFTDLVLEYLEELHEEDEILFPFKRQRGWRIVNHITGFWPHWFRAQAERMYGKLIGGGPEGIYKLRDFLNVANIQTLGKYIKTEWEESRENLLKGAP